MQSDAFYNLAVPPDLGQIDHRSPPAPTVDFGISAIGVMNIYARHSETFRSWGIFWLILAECLVAGMITGWAYVCSLDGHFEPRAFTLAPVFQISSIVGVFMGSMLAPFIFLSMRHLRFLIRAACYLLVITAASLLEMWLHSGFSGAVATIIAACLVCALTQRSCDV